MDDDGSGLRWDREGRSEECWTSLGKFVSAAPRDLLLRTGQERGRISRTIEKCRPISEYMSQSPLAESTDEFIEGLV
jgi:hypothetical protein